MRSLRTVAALCLFFALVGCNAIAGIFDPINGNWDYASDTTASYTLGSVSLSPDKSFRAILTSSVNGGSVTATATGSWTEDSEERTLALTPATSDFPAGKPFAPGTPSTARYTVSADGKTLVLAFDDGTITFTRK